MRQLGSFDPVSTGERRRRLAAATAAGLGLVFVLGAWAILSQGVGFGYDFDAYYMAIDRLASGGSLYLDRTVTGSFTHGGHGLYVYAPPLAVALLPLHIFDSGGATVAWYVLRIVAVIAACLMMPVKPWIRLAAFAVTAFSAPFLSDLSLGNISAMLLPLLAAAWRWLDRPASAVAVAATIAIRPQMALLVLWWALRRRWSMVAWCIGAGLILVLSTLPVVGVSGYRDFVQVMANIRFGGAPNNLAIQAIASDLGLPDAVGSLGFLAGAAIAAGAVIVARQREAELGFVVGVAATLLVAPLLWSHYLVLTVLPAAFMAERGRWWAIGLPLLGWLPAALLPLVALLGVIGPLTLPKDPSAALEQESVADLGA